MKRYNIIAIVLLAALSSCTERIDIELNDEENERLVVDATFTDEQKAHEVILTKTTSYFDNQEAPKATGAIVTISSDAGDSYPLTEVEPGIYKTAADVKGEVGKTYTLSINYEGQLYTGVSTLKRVAQIDSAALKPAEYDFNNNGTEDDDFLVSLYAQEPAGIGDYYMWEGIINGVKVTDTLSRLLFADDELWDGQYVEDIGLDGFAVHPGDTVDVYMLSISKEMFDFLIAANLETNWRGGMFDGPPANLPSIINNGAIGFFSASAVSHKRLVVPK